MARLVITEPAKDELRQIWFYIAEMAMQNMPMGNWIVYWLNVNCLVCYPRWAATDRHRRGTTFFSNKPLQYLLSHQNDTVFVMHIVDAARDIKNIEF